jgi:competence protein ComEC
VRRHFRLGVARAWQGILDTLSNQADHRLHWMPVFVAIGVAIYFTLPIEPHMGIGVLGIMLTGGMMMQFIDHPGKFWAWAYLSLIIAGILAGMIRTHSVDHVMLAGDHGPAGITGQISSAERVPDGMRVSIENLSIEDMAADKTPSKIRLKLRQSQLGADIPRPGQMIDVVGILKPPSPPPAPGAFDFQRHAYFNGIGAYGFAIKDPVVNGAPDGDLLSGIRHRLRSTIYDHLDGDTAAVMAALMIGETAGLTDHRREVFAAAGLAHILAISGMHIGLIAGIVFIVARKSLAVICNYTGYFPVKKFAAMLSLFAAVGYMMIVGAGVPTQRAVIMTGLVIGAILIDRSPVTLRLVAVAALAILLLRPESLMGPSFQMSFAAVTALVAFYDAVRDRLTAAYRQAGMAKRGWLYLLGIIMTTLVAEAAIAPLSIHHFHHTSVLGVIANVLVMPMLSFVVMPVILLGFLLSTIGSMEWILPIAGAGIDYMIDVAEWTVDTGWADIKIGRVHAGGIIAMAIGTIWIILWQGAGKWIGGAILAAGMLALPLANRPLGYVNGDGSVVGLVGMDGELYLSNTRKDRFTTQFWLDQYGHRDGDGKPWPDNHAAVADPRFPMRCDGTGCVYTHPAGHKIAVTHNLFQIGDDCRLADVVIVNQPVERSCNAKVVDRFDLWRYGPHAIFLEGDRIVVRPTRDPDYRRPWVARR